MITLVHCNIEDAPGFAINGFARASDCIFKNCWRAIDNRDDLTNKRQLTSQLFNVTARPGNTAIQFNLFINIEDTALTYEDHANGIERAIRRNTFINCPTAIDRSSVHYNLFPGAYDTVPTTYTQVIDNVFDGVDDEIKQNYALVSEDYNLTNGSINGDVTLGANSIGPGLSPRYQDADAENWRLRRAGVLAPDGSRPLLNSPGALVNSISTDMGAYHRTDSAATLFTRLIGLDSPNKSPLTLRSINSEVVDGLGFIHGGTTGTANAYDLDYSNDNGHTRIAALHAFRAGRASRTDICWSRIGDLQLPTPDQTARIIRDRSTEYTKWLAMWRNDPVWTDGLLTGHHLALQIEPILLYNANRPDQIRYRARNFFRQTTLPTNLPLEWTIGSILTVFEDGVTPFDIYSTTGNPADTVVDYPQTFIVTEYGTDDSGEFLILDPLTGLVPLAAPTFYTASFTRAEWFGVFQILFSATTDKMYVDLRGLSSIPDAHPGMFDGFNLAMSYADQIDIELPLGPSYIPINNVPWFPGDQWLLANQLACFRLKFVSEPYNFDYQNQYEIEPIGPNNPILPSLSDAYKTKIGNSMFVGGIWNQFVTPNYEEVNVQHGTESTRDEWVSNGSEMLPTMSQTRERTSRSMAGATEKYIQTAVPRQAWPFERG